MKEKRRSRGGFHQPSTTQTNNLKNPPPPHSKIECTFRFTVGWGRVYLYFELLARLLVKAAPEEGNVLFIWADENN
jgi:hypothetical protein